jgi:glycosyltransferase involved in cell wall biosynthesis
MTVYNQEKYVGEAIEGVIRQQTSFPFELIVADDCSTDGTREICEQYAAEHPDVVRYTRRERNLGMMANFCRTLEECDGDYIAICEGDDYWIDVNKLQLQFDFLETHEDFSMACHNHYQLRGTELVESYSELKDDFRSLTTTDYMLDPHFQTASYFLRRSAMPKPFPEWYSNVLAGDHFLVLLLSLKGKIGFFNRRMSVFRVFATSMTGSRGPLSIKENFVEHLRLFDIDTKGEFSETIRKVIRRWDLAYKVYEPIGYFSKLFFFIRNLAFYVSNFERVGGLKLGAKYVFSLGAFERVKHSVSPT